jgi:23S rRNA (cytidine1920-2'-O)/16S rRNA (cytidine1409-2'-O)-methyltransferase
MKTQPPVPKRRLDLLLLERGLADSRHKAQAVILAGKVRVAGKREDKAGAQVPIDAAIEIAGSGLRYASRGGVKLEGALQDFGIDPSGRICLDVGASTGGFTDCLLQNGAGRVYAVDVTASQLDWKLQNDPRVKIIEANARYLMPEALPERPSLITADLSFISVTKIVPRLEAVAAPDADILILVKPQFELERKDIGRGGIVRDPELHDRAIENVRRATASAGFTVLAVKPSRLTGAEGNQEFFLHARSGRAAKSEPPTPC